MVRVRCGGPGDTPKLELMSRGFRDSDSTQALSEQATATAIDELLQLDREAEAHAEARRAEGGYGVCEDCGRQIGQERLEVLPTATRCIRCQAAWEQANRF